MATTIPREIKKTYLSAEALLETAFALGQQLLDSDFRPTVIVAICRGGAPVASAVQEILAYGGVATRYCAVSARSYRDIDQSGIAQRGALQIDGLEPLAAQLSADDRLLLVDDVQDSGATLTGLRQRLLEIPLSETVSFLSPAAIKTAVAYYKPACQLPTAVAPDYFVHCSDDWLVFPHELQGLSEEELRRHRPGLADFLLPKR